MAWLHATPTGDTKSRLKSIKDLNENASELILPELEAEGYLMPLLHESGLVSQTGMSIAPLTWTEIHNWNFCTGLGLSVWELSTIHQLSEAYSNEYNAASEKERPAPYSHIFAEEGVIDREAVASKIKNVLRSLMKKD